MPNKACGNPNCSRSTGIHEGITFGSGKPDEFGYWEFPCSLCARDWDANRQKTREEIRSEFVKNNPSKTAAEIDNYLKTNHEWLFIQAWPFN